MPRKNNQRRKKAAEVVEDENNVDENGVETNGEQVVGDDEAGSLETKIGGLRIDDTASNRACSSVLTSHPESRDLHMIISINFYSQEILADAELELNNGRRYGLIGRNGVGKSTLLQVLANREINYPSHFDSYLLQGEFEKCDKTVMQAVVDVDATRTFLEQEADELAIRDDDESQSRLMDVYARLEEIESDCAEAKAGRILRGLGFTANMIKQKVSEFSGGWRMRIALARALFVRPSLLLLDEPTNHLDLESCVWLEEELKRYPRILVVISHSQDFLNSVCTNIIRQAKHKLMYYSGNYDAYVRTRAELEENQSKRYKWEQAQQQHLKDYIAKYGHGTAKLAAQAKSREKLLAKMVAAGQTEAVVADKSLEFSFPSCGELPPPVIMVQNVSFRYSSDKPYIYHNLDTGIDLQTRVALVGPNGAGKSTFLKLIMGELEPSDGCVRRHSHVRIGRYHQHLADQVDLDASAIDWMMRQYPDIKEVDEMRQSLGRYGLTGAQQTCPIRVLSDGLRCRVVFAWLAFRSPHILLLDEPTNHLDIETIDSLADAINAFDGGVLLVSHDFRLISQVAREIWICDKGAVRRYEGDIYTYKQKVLKRVLRLNKETMLTKQNGAATGN